MQMKKILSILLVAVMLISVIPFTAFASTPSAYADLKNTTTVITFDNKQWYMIEDNSTSATEGTVTLLSKECAGKSVFGSNNTYSGSTLETYVNNWYSENITADAKTAVADNKAFILESLNGINTDVLKCNQVEGTYYNLWWLSSPSYSKNRAKCVDGQVGYLDDAPVSWEYGVRPVLQLDLSKVEFDSETKTFALPAPAPEPEPTVTWDAATENIQIGWDCNQLNPYDDSYTKDAITVSATSKDGHTYINGTSFQESFMGNLSGFVFTNSVANFSKIKLVFTDLSIVGYNQFFDSEYNVDPNWSSDLDSKTVTWEGDSNSVGLYAYGVEGTLDRIEFTYEEPAPAYTTGFMVGSDHFDDLEDAIAAAKAGSEKTVTFLQDVDFTVYPAFTRHTLDLTGVTLDLDGHTITGYNHSVVYVGDNFTIKNGNMVCVYDSVNNKKESYAAVIYPQVGNWQTDVVTDKSTGVVLENLVLTGGINCFGADVTVRGENTNVTGNYYYALWADVLATLTVEDGTFTSAASSTNGIIGACSDAGKEAYVYISGGEYTVPAGKNLVLQSTMASSQQLVEISGGTYNVVVPAKACAAGFVPVTEPNAQGKYTVAVVQYGTIEQMTGATITGNGTAHEKITISNVNLNYADPDYSVGRYYAGYYLSGVKFIAPAGTVISENARYTNGSIDSQTGQLKVKNLYTAKDGANYMYSWPHVTEESLKEAIDAGVNKTWEYTFDWDGDGIFEQEAIIEIVCDTVTLVKGGQQIYPVPANNGANLALEGIIEENIYIDADAYNLGEGAVIKVTYNANTNISETAQEVTDVYNVKDLTPYTDPKGTYTGTYKFSFKQAPAQITEDVIVALYADENAQEPVKTITYSVKDYCDEVIETSNNAKLVALCKSILDYARAAQLEFNYNTDNMAVDTFYNADAIEALTYSDITGTTLTDTLGVTGCAFQCLANTNINLYIDYPLTGAGIINAYVDDGNDQTPVSATYMRSTKTGRLFISVSDIAADDMTKDFTVVTSDNGSVTTNLNTIVKTCLYYGTATTLAKTIYFYADAANTYFN